QQVLRCRRMVDRVAVCAGHAVDGVLGAPNVGLGQIEGVTYQAGVENLLRRHERKCARNGGFAAPCLYVLLPGSVASFATRALRRLLAGGDAYEVRILIEIQKYVGMADAARIAADVPARGGSGRARLWRGLRVRRRQNGQKQQQE